MFSKLCLHAAVASEAFAGASMCKPAKMSGSGFRAGSKVSGLRFRGGDRGWDSGSMYVYSFGLYGDNILLGFA